MSPIGSHQYQGIHIFRRRMDYESCSLLLTKHITYFSSLCLNVSFRSILRAAFPSFRRPPLATKRLRFVPPGLRFGKRSPCWLDLPVCSSVDGFCGRRSREGCPGRSSSLSTQEGLDFRFADCGANSSSKYLSIFDVSGMAGRLTGGVTLVNASRTTIIDGLTRSNIAACLSKAAVLIVGMRGCVNVKSLVLPTMTIPT